MSAEVAPKGRNPDLVAAAQAGDTRAADELYRRYRGPLTQYCQRLTGQIDATEELVQETFLRALENLGRFDPSAPVWPWLSAIARNLSIDRGRAVARHTERHERHERLAMIGDLSAEDSAIASAERAEIRASLSGAFKEIPPRYRRLLFLKAVEEWSYADLARADGSTVTGVAKVLNRAKERIRLHLEQSSGHPLGVLPVVGAWFRRKGRAMRDGLGQWGHPLGTLGARLPFEGTVHGLIGVALMVGVAAGPTASWATVGDAPVLQDAPRQVTVTTVGPRVEEARPRSSVTLVETENAKVETAERREDGVDPTGGRLRIEVYGTDGKPIWWYEQEHSCGKNDNLTPQGSPVMVYC